MSTLSLTTSLLTSWSAHLSTLPSWTQQTLTALCIITMGGTLAFCALYLMTLSQGIDRHRALARHRFIRTTVGILIILASLLPFLWTVQPILAVGMLVATALIASFSRRLRELEGSRAKHTGHSQG